MEFVVTRAAAPEDSAHPVGLLRANMEETFSVLWRGSERALCEDGFGTYFHVTLATCRTDLIGFEAWRISYDLHNCVNGGEVMDMFVLPRYRGRGVAIVLLASFAREVARDGGKYVKGRSVERPSVRRMYRRFARCFPGADCVVGGRAFRASASLKGKSPREMTRELPRKEWNDER